ncbi:MAG: hypothetical protein V3T05_05930 [Myxococcota bacterium]
MSAWDYPVFIIATLIGGIVVTAWLFRIGNPLRRGPDFECDLCGRKANGNYAKEWRFCPFCGTPKRIDPPRY